MIETSSFEPMLKTSPTASSLSINLISAPTTSLTKPKQRVCSPVPKTVMGRPDSACLTKVGMTMPYCPVCRGPTDRAVRHGHPDLRQAGAVGSPHHGLRHGRADALLRLR